MKNLMDGPLLGKDKHTSWDFASEVPGHIHSSYIASYREDGRPNHVSQAQGTSEHLHASQKSGSANPLSGIL